MSQTVTTKLYTRDEVIKLVKQVHRRAVRKTANDFAKDGLSGEALIILTGAAVKMAMNADRKLERLLNKAEGKK